MVVVVVVDVVVVVEGIRLRTEWIRIHWVEPKILYPVWQPQTPIGVQKELTTAQWVSLSQGSFNSPAKREKLSGLMYSHVFF